MRFLTPYRLDIIKDITSVGISEEDISEFSGYVPSDLVTASSFYWSGDTLTINFESKTFEERRVKSIFLMQGNEPRGIIIEDTLQVITCRVMQIIVTFDVDKEGVHLFNHIINSGPYLNKDNPFYGPITGKVVVADQESAESLNHGQPFRKGLIVHDNETFDIPLTFQRFDSEILEIIPTINRGRPIMHIRTVNSKYLLFLDTRTGYKYAGGNSIDGFSLTDISDQTMIRGAINCTAKYDYLTGSSMQTIENEVFCDMWEMLNGDDDIKVIGQSEGDVLLASYNNLSEAFGQDVRTQSIYRYLYHDLTLILDDNLSSRKVLILENGQGFYRRYRGKFKMFPYQNSLMFFVNDYCDKNWNTVSTINNFISTEGEIVFPDNTYDELKEVFPIQLFGKNFLIIKENTLVYIDE